MKCAKIDRGSGIRTTRILVKGLRLLNVEQDAVKPVVQRIVKLVRGDRGEERTGCSGNNLRPRIGRLRQPLIQRCLVAWIKQVDVA